MNWAARSVFFIQLAVFASAAFPAPISTIAGTGEKGLGPNEGEVIRTNLGEPFGVEQGPDGALYVCEVTNHRVRRVELKTGRIATVAGCGEKGYAGDGGAATAAKLNEPYEVRFDREGNMFLVEMQNHVVRRVDAKTKVISTVAGTGQPGYGGDGGPASKAQLRQPHSIALDDKQHLFIADIGNHRIRRVDLASGTIETIAGTGEAKLPVAGEVAKGHPVLGPRALFWREGVLWVALREGHSVWRIADVDGQWIPVAGTGKKGFTGDGGPAREATFDGPKGIAVDGRGNIFVADTENHALRRIDGASGIISTVAGQGPTSGGFGGDGGPAAKSKFNRPHGVGLGADGTLYIGDTNNHRVRKVGEGM